MRKLCLYLIVLAALLLSACSQTTALPSAPTKDANTSKPENTKAAAAQPTLQSGPSMQCQVVSLSPTQGPTEASMFPPVSSDDWVLGNQKSPALTLIEYSDFQ